MHANRFRNSRPAVGFRIVTLLALTGLAPPAAHAGTVATRIEDEALAWDQTPALPLDAHFGATLALAESSSGDGYFAFVGAPGGGAAQPYEIGTGDPLWSTRPPVLPTAAQPMPVAIDGFFLHAALDPGGATTSIWRTDTGQVLVAGLDGGPVRTLAKRGSILAVGQPDFFGGAGRVRIYEQNGGTWVHAKTYVGGFPDRLGAALAVDGLTVVAGAPGWGDSGAVRVFARAASWIELQLIPGPDIDQSGAEFGAAVALDGDLLAVGAPRLDWTVGLNLVPNAGGVFVYEVVTPPFLQFEFQTLLHAAELNPHDWLGTSVDLMEERATGAVELVAGAPGEDTAANNGGAVYRYLRTGDPEAASWHLVTRMTQSAPVDLEQLGTTVALAEVGILAGAPFGSSGAGATSGLALFFDARIFADGFESGDTSAWTEVFP